MKLINRTLLFLSAIMLLSVSLWAFIYYYRLLNLIRTTIDEGLEDYKIVVIDKLKDDNLLIEQKYFVENNYIVKRVNEDYALNVRDSYKDTLIYSPLKKSSYQTRLLTTAFVASDGKYYEMKVISQEIDKTKLIEKLAFSLIWLYLFILASTLLASNFTLKKTWKPFYQLLDYLNEFRLDKGAYREHAKTKIKEFNLLNESVNTLIKTNIDIFNSQKQFIENASHELQTPLAIGLNKLELLAGDENLTTRQILKIGNIIDVFQRLSSLNKSLLLLSKIENKLFPDEEVVHFNEIIKRIIKEFSDYIEFRKIEVSYLEEDQFMIKMNKDLGEILLMNLIKNAIIHNQIEGKLFIKIAQSSLLIENSSELPSLEPDKLFVRFHKNSKNINSTGLGLAIVKAIAGIYGLLINYSYNGKHIFMVSKIIP